MFVESMRRPEFGGLSFNYLSGVQVLCRLIRAMSRSGKIGEWCSRCEHHEILIVSVVGMVSVSVAPGILD